MFLRLLPTIFILLTWMPVELDAQDWKTGRELTKWLSREKLSVNLQPSPIGEYLKHLAIRSQIAIVVDRNVDPNLKSPALSGKKTFEQLLWSVTNTSGLGVCRLGDVYYVGPKSTCEVLPIIYETTKKSLSKNRRASKINWSKRSVVNIPRLNNPREMVAQIAESNGLNIRGLQNIPFDVRPKLDVPECNLLQQIVFQIVGFGLWPQISKDGTSVELVELPQVQQGEIRITGVVDAKTILAELKSDHPACKISASKKGIVARGTPKDLASVRADLVHRQSTKSKDGGVSSYSIRLSENTRGNALATLAKQLGVTLEYEEAAKSELLERLTLDVINASSDEIIRKLIGPNLKYELSSQTLKIFK